MILSPVQQAVLARVAEVRGPIATQWMNKAAGYPGDTAKTRRVLLSLQRQGLVEGLRSTGGNVFWWEATDEGRALLAEGVQCL